VKLGPAKSAGVNNESPLDRRLGCAAEPDAVDVNAVVGGVMGDVAGFDNLLLTPTDEEASEALALTAVTDGWLGRYVLTDGVEFGFEG
jgi:hypothetical protein